MGTQDFIVVYVQSCTGGKLPLGECGPVWQLGVIAVLLVSAIVALMALRLRANLQAAHS